MIRNINRTITERKAPDSTDPRDSLAGCGSAVIPLLMVALAACGAGDPNADKDTGEKQLRVGVTVYDMSLLHHRRARRGWRPTPRTTTSSCCGTRPTTTSSTQANQVDQLINQSVDAIIIVPVQADSLGPQMASAKAANIPVIAVNTALPTARALAGHVQPDDVAAGAQEMQMMADKLGGKGNIVVLQGPLGSSGNSTAPRASEQSWPSTRTSRSWPWTPPTGSATKRSTR